MVYSGEGLKRRVNVKNTQEIPATLMEIEKQLTEMTQALFDLNTQLIFKAPDSFNTHRFDYVIKAIRLTRETLIIQKQNIENVRLLYGNLCDTHN